MHPFLSPIVRLSSFFTDVGCHSSSVTLIKFIHTHTHIMLRHMVHSRGANKTDMEWYGAYTYGMSFCRGSIVNFKRVASSERDAPIGNDLQYRSIADVITILKETHDGPEFTSSILFTSNVNAEADARLASLYEDDEYSLIDMRACIASVFEKSHSVSLLVVHCAAMFTLFVFDDIQATIAELEQVQAFVIEHKVTQQWE